MEICIPNGKPGSQIAWSAGNNLLALSIENDRSKKTDVCILDPSCPEEHAAFPLVEDGINDQLLSLAWSPLEQKPLLMAAMQSGKCLMWAQAPSTSRGDSMITISDWQSHHAFQTPSAPVMVKWLEAPTCWRWPKAHSMQDTAQPQGLESPFGPQIFTQQKLSWLRPGTLACVIIMRNSRFQVAWWGRSPGEADCRWQQSTPVTLPVLGEVLHADVTVTSSGTLRALTVSQSDPSKFIIMSVSGNPTLLKQDGKPIETMHCEELAQVNGANEGYAVISAAFQPQSLGTALVVISQSNDQLMLWRFTEDSASSKWERVCSQIIGDAKGFSLLQSLVGTSALAAYCTSSGSSQLSVIDSESLEVLHVQSLPRQCRALAASPNVCCLITCHPDGNNSNGTRLLVHDLPMHFEDGSTEAAHALSLRVCWSLVRRTSAWDLLRNVAMLSREQSSLAADLLSRLDTALHTERYTQRPAYGLALNAFKLQLLAGVKDATAQAVCMDIRANSYLQNLSGQSKLLCRPDRSAPESLLGHVSIPAEDAAALEPWVAWVEGYVPFLLGCLRRWVQQRRNVSSENTEDLSSCDALPCVRLLPDGYFQKTLFESVAVCEVACRALEIEGSLKPRSARMKELAEAVRTITAVVVQDQRAAGLANNTQSEALGAHLDAAKNAQAVFRGAYGLHYYRTLGGVRPVEAFADPTSRDLHSVLRNCKPLSDAEIEAAGRKLSLIREPAMQTSSSRKRRALTAAQQPSLILDEDPFRVKIPELAEYSLRLKRQRWQAALKEALGAALNGDTREGEEQIDIITGDKFSWALQPRCMSVDGLCSTSGAPALDKLSSLSSSLYSQIFYSTALSACPVTGSSWRKLQIF